MLGKLSLHLLQSLSLAARLWSAGIRLVRWAFLKLLVEGLRDDDGVCELDLLISVIVSTDMLS